MAGCSKKQYAIMMSSGPEGQKLISKMGKMDQQEFNKAFSDLLSSDAATEASAKAENSKWSPEDDEYYQDFDVTSDEDFEDEDIKEDKKGLVKETLVDKFNDAHLYNDGGKYQLTLSNGETKEFDTKNEAIDYLSEYSKRNYSWAKDVEDSGELNDSKKYIRKNGMIIVVDDDGNPTGEQYPDENNAIDINGSINDWEEVEEKTEEQKEDLITDNDVPDENNENRLAEGGLKGRFERAGHEVTDVTDKSMIVDGKYKIVDVGNGGFDVYADDKKIANDIGNQKDFVTLIDEYESRQGAFTSSKGDNPYPGKQEKRWSDDLEDNEYTKEYRPDVERMDPQRADAIAKAMEEYVAENPTRGFINADQIKRYSEKLGLANMDDDELSQMWYDIDNVGGLYEHGKPYDKGGRELGDARSAFIELVNKEARDRRGGKTKEDALAKIKAWADEIGKYDLDDSRAYLTGQQGDYIERAVDKHGITKSELQALHPSVFGPSGYSQYGKEEPKTATATETWPPQDLKQYVKKIDNGYAMDLDIFKDKTLEEVEMLLDHPDAKTNLVVKQGIMAALYQKLREQPGYGKNR